MYCCLHTSIFFFFVPRHPPSYLSPRCCRHPVLAHASHLPPHPNLLPVRCPTRPSRRHRASPCPSARSVSIVKSAVAWWSVWLRVSGSLVPSTVGHLYPQPRPSVALRPHPIGSVLLQVVLVKPAFQLSKTISWFPKPLRFLSLFQRAEPRTKPRAESNRVVSQTEPSRPKSRSLPSQSPCSPSHLSRSHPCWVPVSFGKGVREVTLEFLDFTASVVWSQLSSTWIRLDADLDKNFNFLGKGNTRGRPARGKKDASFMSLCVLLDRYIRNKKQQNGVSLLPPGGIHIFLLELQAELLLGLLGGVQPDVEKDLEIKIFCRRKGLRVRYCVCGEEMEIWDS
ncbi:hypothetical protein E5676_scaffold419G00760 [Cucumis melo var. makuwa]|uniref:Uncharacterized protein n=1 Tax=Cucumis melo var. makuwa TaxID=1194695 RepID=A0A5D3DJW1_CUCMM|nr:hypothetical protein E5676_scaffold419G00760 [Cucumis melo var. makuwa]